MKLREAAPKTFRTAQVLIPRPKLYKWSTWSNLKREATKIDRETEASYRNKKCSLVRDTIRNGREPETSDRKTRLLRHSDTGQLGRAHVRDNAVEAVAVTARAAPRPVARAGAARKAGP